MGGGEIMLDEMRVNSEDLRLSKEINSRGYAKQQQKRAGGGSGRHHSPVRVSHPCFVS